MKIKHYCDNCGEELSLDFTHVSLSFLGGEELIFCGDTDCQDEFIREHTREIYIDCKGRLIED